MWFGEPHPFPKEDHLPDWTRWDNQVKKGDHVEYIHYQLLTFMEPCIARCVFCTTNEMQLIQCSLLLSALDMFRMVFLSVVMSL